MTHRLGILAVATCFGAAQGLAAQASSELLRAARSQISVQNDSAVVLLQAALAAAATRPESIDVLVWTGIAQFYANQDSLVRGAFRAAFALNPELNVKNLDRVSPRLARMFDVERLLVQQPNLVFMSSDLDVPPEHQGGPPVVYPWDVWRRRASGRALLSAIVDTAGFVEPGSIEIHAVPDSGLIEPLRAMMRASLYTPGVYGGRPVRTRVSVATELKPGPPPNPTQLVAEARVQLAAGNADSALALAEFALDSAVRPSEGARAYAQLVRSVALDKLGREGAARAARDSGLAGYRALTARGVDLAPVLRRVADSLDRAARGAPVAGSRLGAPTVVGGSAEPPALLEHPPIRYPPEMRTLGVSGTVILEAVLDTTGRVVATSLRVVQSPNPGLDGEARRVVLGARYRPSRRQGKAVQVTIRQPILFAGY